MDTTLKEQRTFYFHDNAGRTYYFHVHAGDYEDGDPTQEERDRLVPHIMAQLSEAEAISVIERALNELAREGKAERHTDEYGETRFRMRDAS